MCCPGCQDAKVKKRSKKIITCNVQFPPLSFVHIPFDVLRVIINDAFCEAPHATIHSTLKATTSGTHVTEVMRETQGWRVWESGGLGKSGDPPPPRGRGIEDRPAANISPPWPPTGYRVFFGPRPKAKPVRTKTGKIVGYGLLVASKG